jgi:hypothetical protein
MSNDQQTNARSCGPDRQAQGDVGRRLERGVSNAATADSLLDCVVIQQGNTVKIQLASEPNPPASSQAGEGPSGSESNDQSSP